jgi:purine-binding chemotaxis protein CheW
MIKEVDMKALFDDPLKRSLFKRTKEEPTEVVLKDEQKILLFALGQEEFGIEVESVREIIPMVEITELPNSPFWLEGVIDLRGKVIPVVNLSKVFGEEREVMVSSKILVTEEIGLAVDKVREIQKIEGSQFTLPQRSSPLFRYLKGVVTLPTKSILIVNPKQIAELIFSEIDRRMIVAKRKRMVPGERGLLRERAMHFSQKKERREAEKKRFLVFEIEGENYGISVSNVYKVIKLPEIRAIPSGPKSSVGILSLEGTIISLLNLRKMFGWNGDAETKGQIVVVEKAMRKRGLLVDRVLGLFDIEEEKVQPVLSTIDPERSAFFEGEVKIGDRLIALLNIKKLFG